MQKCESSSNPTVSVPALALGPHPTITLASLESNEPIVFHADRGSCCTCITPAYAAKLGLTVLPISSDPAMPNHLGVADGVASMLVTGITYLTLPVPNSATTLRVPTAVVSSLFCPALLGRNALQAFDDAYGNMCVYAGEESTPVVSALLGLSEKRLQDGIIVRSSLAVYQEANMNANTASVESSVRAVFFIPETHLRTPEGQPIMELQGMFTAGVSGKSPKCLLPHSAVTATVDWSPSGSHGPLRAISFLTSATSTMYGKQRRICILELNQAIGTFHLGRGSIVSSITLDPTANTMAKTDPEILNTLLMRVTVDNPLLPTPLDRKTATSTLGLFHFCEDLPTAGRALTDPFVIELVPGTRPAARHNYPMTATEEVFAEKQLQTWLKNGTIVPSTSAWSSPVLIAVHPRTKKLRFCVDYRTLNSVTMPDAYLLPRITDITTAIKKAGARIFSKVDLSNGFNQFGVHPDSQHVTSFRGIRHGTYQFAGSPFGLRNLPASFQRLMDRVLGDMLWERACCYVDDIIVFSPTLAQHHVDLIELAKRLAQFNIWARASKCEFYKEEVEFLGYFLSANGIRVMPDRVAGVIGLGVPTNRKELRSLMGLLNQFRNNIFDYGRLAAPLEAMKHKTSNTPFDISEGSIAHTSFLLLKAALIEMPSLAVPDMNRPFKCWADASHHAMSFILCQADASDPTFDRVIGFYSKAFVGDELLWGMPRKEATCLHHFATGACWPFLAGAGPHTIFVDNVSSGALTKSSIKSAPLMRQAIDLQELPIIIKRIPGKLNAADAPTRPPFITADPHLTALAPDTSPLRKLDNWNDMRELADAMAPVPSVAILVPLVRPDGLPGTAAMVAAAQDADISLLAIKSFILANRPALPAGSSKAAIDTHQSLSASSRGLVVLDNGVLIRLHIANRKPIVQTVVPTSQRATVLNNAHSTPAPGLVHGGKNNRLLFEEVSRFAWWARLREDCDNYECPICNINKKDHRAPSGLLHSTPVGAPGSIVSCDWVPQLADMDGYKGYFLFCDKFSGAAFAAPAKVKNADTATAAFLASPFATFFQVQLLVVDADTTLTSAAFKTALGKRSVIIRTAIANHQQANFVERLVQQVKTLCRLSLSGIPTIHWRQVLLDIINYYNITYIEGRMAAPCTILTGWIPAGVLPYALSADTQIQGHVFASREALRDVVRANLDKAASQHMHSYNQGRVDRRFIVGDIVLVKELRPRPADGAFNLSPPYNPNPFIVVAVLSEVSYYVQSTENHAAPLFELKHISDLKAALNDPVNDLLTLQAAALAGGANFVVQHIHNHRILSPAPFDREYLVEWGGWRDKRSYTWEPYASFSNSAVAIRTAYDTIVNI